MRTNILDNNSTVVDKMEFIAEFWLASVLLMVVSKIVRFFLKYVIYTLLIAAAIKIYIIRTNATFDVPPPFIILICVMGFFFALKVMSFFLGVYEGVTDELAERREQEEYENDPHQPHDVTDHGDGRVTFEMGGNNYLKMGNSLWIERNGKYVQTHHVFTK